MESVSVANLSVEGLCITCLSSEDLFVDEEDLGQDDEPEDGEEDEDEEEAEALPLRAHLGDAGPPRQPEMAALRGQLHPADSDRARTPLEFCILFLQENGKHFHFTHVPKAATPTEG